MAVKRAGGAPGRLTGKGGRPKLPCMSLSAIEEEVLWACGDDYEAPHTIAAHVAREMERPVSESEVRAAFLSLAESGHVQPFLFDERLKEWKPVPPEVAKRDPSVWFMATAKGTAAVEDGDSP